VTTSFELIDRGLRSRYPDDALGIWRRVLATSDYQAVLARLLGFVAPLERALDVVPLLPSFVDMRGRAKAPLLAADLEALDVSRAAQLALPRCESIPPLENPRTAIGWMYAVERSTLAHEEVLQRLAGKLPRLDSASAYMRCYSDADAKWQNFGRAVQGVTTTMEAGLWVFDAASAAIECLAAWLGA
jgi:heme oxygenase